MGQSDGITSIHTALLYVEQQSQATASDVQLFRCWCELVANEREEAHRETHVTKFLKNELSFTNLHYVKYYFCL
jgi:hypothetical protein